MPFCSLLSIDGRPSTSTPIIPMLELVFGSVSNSVIECWHGEQSCLFMCFTNLCTTFKRDIVQVQNAPKFNGIGTLV